MLGRPTPAVTIFVDVVETGIRGVGRPRAMPPLATSQSMKNFDPARLFATLDALHGSISSELTLVEDSIAEQRRQAHAATKRRKRDAARYVLGGTFMALGFDRLDDTMLVGLFAHPDLMLRWLVEAREARGPASFADLIARILADPVRSAWCREWGVYLRWDRQKQLYDAEVASFIASGRTGPKERWRRDPVTVGQAWLIELVCELAQMPNPALATKGEAFEWLYAAGGDPRFATKPATPNFWSERS